MDRERASKSPAKPKAKEKPKVEHGSPHSPVDRDTPEREKVRGLWKRQEPRR